MLNVIKHSPNAVWIKSTTEHRYDPVDTAGLFKLLHLAAEPFALETVGTPGKLGFVVRTKPEPSSVRSRLESVLGRARVQNGKDPLMLGRDEGASVRLLLPTAHAGLPTGGYNAEATFEMWRAIAAGPEGRGYKPFDGKWIVRVVVDPAPDSWPQTFSDGFRPGRFAPTETMSKLLAFRYTPDVPDDIDKQLAALKVVGPAFYFEIQVATTYQDNRGAKKSAKAALAKLTDQIINVMGGRDLWRKGATKDVAGRKLYRGGEYQQGLAPWKLVEFLEPGKAKFFISPRELAPMWRARQTVSHEVAATAVRAPQPDLGEIPRPDPVRTTATPADATPEPPDDAVEAGRSVGAEDRGPNATTAPARLPSSNGHEAGRASFHSARPPGLTVATEENLAERRPKNQQRSMQSDRRHEVVSDAKTSVVRELGLTERDLVIIDHMRGMPLASARDIAYACGQSPTTVYKAVAALEQRGLALSVAPHIGRAQEQRYWIPDDRWDMIMDDRPVPHTAEVVRRRWLNPDMLAGVYRAVAMLVQDVPDRQLDALRWLHAHAFDAVAQFTDGWAAFLWVGPWMDQEHLQERLRACAENLREWSGGRGTHWPGKLITVVPHRWQEEIVWRAARSRGWQDACAVYNVHERIVAGDLDLGASRGRIPPAIGDQPKILRLDVSDIPEFLIADKANRMTRLTRCIEQYPGIIASHLQGLTSMNGAELAAGLQELVSLGRISQWSDSGFRAEPQTLSAAARRDRVWIGLPGRRFGPDALSQYTSQRWKTVTEMTRLLSKFARLGCPVAPGWQAIDGAFRPHGVVWMQSLYGEGWHYVVHAGRARQESTVSSVLARALSETRADRYPILVVCQETMEREFWHLGAGKPMLTASTSRLRSGPVAGPAHAYPLVCCGSRAGRPTCRVGERGGSCTHMVNRTVTSGCTGRSWTPLPPRLSLRTDTWALGPHLQVWRTPPLSHREDR